MLSILAKLEHKIGDKVYHFMCPSDAPIAEVKDALVQFLGHVANVEKEAAAKAASESEAIAPVVEPSVVEEVKE